MINNYSTILPKHYITPLKLFLHSYGIKPVCSENGHYTHVEINCNPSLVIDIDNFITALDCFEKQVRENTRRLIKFEE